MSKPIVRQPLERSNQKLGYEEIKYLALETSKVYWNERVCEDANLVGKGRGVYYTLRMKRTISGQSEKKMDNLKSKKMENRDIITRSAEF